MLFTPPQQQLLKHYWVIAILGAFVTLIPALYPVTETRADYWLRYGIMVFVYGMLFGVPWYVQGKKEKGIYILMFIVVNFEWLFYFSDSSPLKDLGVFGQYLFHVLPMTGLFYGALNKNIRQAFVGYLSGIMLLQFPLPLLSFITMSKRVVERMEVIFYMDLLVRNIIIFLLALPLFCILENIFHHPDKKKFQKELFSSVPNITGKVFAKRFALFYFLLFCTGFYILIICYNPKMMVDRRSQANGMGMMLLSNVPFFLMMVYLTSQVVVRRLQTLDRPITWSYLLSFVPLFNLIPFLSLQNSITKNDLNGESYPTYLKKEGSQFLIILLLLLFLYYGACAIFGYPIDGINGSFAFIMAVSSFVLFGISLGLMKGTKWGLSIATAIFSVILLLFYLNPDARLPFGYYVASFGWFVGACLILRPIVSLEEIIEEKEIAYQYLLVPLLILLILCGSFWVKNTMAEYKSDEIHQANLAKFEEKIDAPALQDYFYFYGSKSIYLKFEEIKGDSLRFSKIDKIGGTNAQRCFERRLANAYIKYPVSESIVWMTKAELKNALKREKGNKPQGKKIPQLKENGYFNLTKIYRLSEPNLRNVSSGGSMENIGFTIKNYGGPTRLTDLKVLSGAVKLQPVNLPYYMDYCGGKRLTIDYEKRGVRNFKLQIKTETNDGKIVFFIAEDQGEGSIELTKTLLPLQHE